MDVVSAEDRLAIEALVIEYAWILDHRHWDEVPGLCTDDVELEELLGRAIEKVRTRVALEA